MAADARVGGIFALKGEAQTKLNEAQRRRHGRAGAAGRSAHRRDAVDRKDDQGKGDDRTPRSGLPARDRSGRPQGRSEAHRGDRQVARRRSVAGLRAECRTARDVAGRTGRNSSEGRGRKAAQQIRLEAQHRTPRVPYKETIRKSTTQHGRHKRQSGGHGQFGDVVLEIRPLPRGAGFVFEDEIAAAWCRDNGSRRSKKGSWSI